MPHPCEVHTEIKEKHIFSCDARNFHNLLDKLSTMLPTYHSSTLHSGICCMKLILQLTKARAKFRLQSFDQTW
jgi:hypothetical protein